MDKEIIIGGKKHSLLPNESQIGDPFLVKFYGSDKWYYAIYSDVDEFDVHLKRGKSKKHRKEWYKFSIASLSTIHLLD